MQVQRGVSLAEMAVTLVIASIIMGGLLVPLATHIEARDAREAGRMLERVHEALVGFAIIHGRLPCPALAGLATGRSPDAGQEALAVPPSRGPTSARASERCAMDGDTGSAPAVYAGVLPWRTLGLPETDPWGRRFSYAVSATFAAGEQCPSTNPQAAWFCIDAAGIIEIVTRRTAGADLVPTASGLAAAVISHGRNGFGGVTPAGAMLPAAPGLDENTNGLATLAGARSLRVVARDPVRHSGACADDAPGQPCEFDDQVIGISAARLVERMVAVGKLP